MPTELDIFEARLRRLEDEVNRSPIRIGIGGAGSVEGIETHLIFPPTPSAGNDEAEIIYLVSVFVTNFPAPRPPLEENPLPKDTYWYAAPGDLRWKPIGGKLTDISGRVATISQNNTP